MGTITQKGNKFLIDVSIKGKRIRRLFPTKKDAEDILEKLEQKKINQLKKELLNEHKDDKNGK